MKIDSLFNDKSDIDSTTKLFENMTIETATNQSSNQGPSIREFKLWIN